MNYQQAYDAIITAAKNKNHNQYTEKHHIIPRCLGGNNNRNNIVSLTYREHFLCHWLLCKIYPDNFKLKAAFVFMIGSSGKRIVSSWMYEVVKRQVRDNHFPWLKNKTPWNKGKIGMQSAWNKGIKTGPLSKEQKTKRSISAKKYWSKNTHPRKGQPAWNSGKLGVQVAWNKGQSAKKFSCEFCHKIIGGKSNYIRWHGSNCKESRKVA